MLVAIIAVLAVEGYLIRDQFSTAWDRVGDIHWGWLSACFVASMANLDSFARVQRALFRSAGVVVSQWRSLSVVLAANSLSQTMPGGQVLAPAFTYRETRRWGANPVVASWQVVMSGLFAGVGLAMLGIGGAVLAGARTSPLLDAVLDSRLCRIRRRPAVPGQSSGDGACVGVANTHLVQRRPQPPQGRWPGTPRSSHRPIGRGPAHPARGRNRLRVEPLQLDCRRLLSAVRLLGDRRAHRRSPASRWPTPRRRRWGTAIPLLPGGLGIVDAAMVAALVPAGMTTGDAVVAVILYRLVSWAIVSLIGWVVILVMFRTRFRSDIDHADDLEEGLRAGAPADPDRPLVGFSDERPDGGDDAGAARDDDGSPGGDDAGDSPSRRRR